MWLRGGTPHYTAVATLGKSLAPPQPPGSAACHAKKGAEPSVEGGTRGPRAIVKEVRRGLRNRIFGRILPVRLLFAAIAVLRVLGPRAEAQTAAPPSGKPIIDIVYAGDESFPPFEFRDERGEAAGFNIDLIRAVGRAQGIRVNCRAMQWQALRSALAGGTVDVAAMYRSPRRAREVDFAVAFEFVYQEMFIRRGSPPLHALADLRGKRVLVEGGTVLAETLSELALGADIREMPNEPAALRALAAGEGDVAFATQTPGRPFETRDALAAEISVTGPPVLPNEFAFVTRRGRPDLILQINEGMGAVKASGEYEKIYRRWLRPDQSADLARRAAWALGAVGLVVVFVVVWNQMLRRRVAEQVDALMRMGSSYNALAAKQAEVDRANKELETFSYSVSHDLRAPLRAIDGYTRILVEDHAQALDAEARRVCGVIRENVRGMGQLIDDLLNFSRLSRAAMEPVEIDMRALAESEFNQAVPAASVGRIAFHLNPLPGALGDPRLLRQVWANLLSNAIKFSSGREQPSIEVSGQTAGEEVVYTVRDNGAGFDMRYADKLFRVFERLHSTREFEGTGVGLAIVQRVVERHGGRVWAEGRVDEGATFHFALPKAG